MSFFEPGPSPTKSAEDGFNMFGSKISFSSPGSGQPGSSIFSSAGFGSQSNEERTSPLLLARLETSPLLLRREQPPPTHRPPGLLASPGELHHLLGQASLIASSLARLTAFQWQARWHKVRPTLSRQRLHIPLSTGRVATTMALVQPQWRYRISATQISRKRGRWRIILTTRKVEKMKAF